MADKYIRVMRAVTEHPWAIRRSTYDTICAVVEDRQNGVKLTKEEIRARIGAERGRTGRQVQGMVGVLPIYGVLMQKAGMFTDISGGTSYQKLLAEFREMRDDPQVKAILLDVDSPGGEVFGLSEAAEEIYAARESKRLVAVCNPLMASAALYLASACHEVVVTPSGQIGSIGTIVKHVDHSAQNEMLGISPTYITSSEYKAEGNPDGPLSDEAEEYLRSQVKKYGDEFEAFVAKARNVSVAKVQKDFGRGRMLMAADAVKVGLADRVATFEDTLARLTGRKSSVGGMRASVETWQTGEVGGDMAPGIDLGAVVTATKSQATTGTITHSTEIISRPVPQPDEEKIKASEAAEAAEAAQAAAQDQLDRDAIAITLALTDEGQS